MTLFSRKTLFSVFLLSANLILLAIVSRVAMADELINELLEQSVYLYYYESDDQLLEVSETQIYTFAPFSGEEITIVSYGLDDTAVTSISLYDENGNLVKTGTSNQVTQKPANSDTEDNPQSPYITAIEYTARSSGLYYFEVKNESGKEGLIRSMLFVGEPFNEDITLIDQLNPLLPSKAFMVAGDPNREWENELTGETIKGLRTEVEVQPIERIDRIPDVFVSYSTLSYLPDVNERLEPVNFVRWFNEDEEEIYLVNIRPLPEEETAENRAILEQLDYDTYNSNNFFFFEYFFTVGNGSDPVALDRGASERCCFASEAERVQAPEVESLAVETAAPIGIPLTTFSVSGEQVTVSFTGELCSSFYGPGEIVDLGISSISGTSRVCVPNAYIDNDIINFDGTSVSGTGVNQQNLCVGTTGDDLIACTTGNDFITALSGDDAVFASDGDDVIYGDAGSDFIVAGEGDDTAYGGDDNDGISGGGGDDTIFGGSGSDRIEGNDGQDTIYGEGDNDVILGGSGNDFIDGGAASFTGGSFSVSGTDASISNSPAVQIIQGGTGEDTIVIDSNHSSATNAWSLIAGNAYVDASYVSVADDETDTYVFEGDPTGEVYLWTDSADALDFTNFNDPVNMVGSDVMLDSDRFIIVYDGGLPSNISGSANDDVFSVSSCAYFIASGCSTDPNYTIDGNDGNDTITTGDGTDTVNGGAGNDTISTGNGSDTITDTDGDNLINSGNDDDTITTGTGNDTIIAGFGNDIVDAGDGNNLINAGFGDDNVTSGAGNDTIVAGAGDDTVNSGDGDDLIDAGLGTDTVDGGIGSDTLTYESVTTSGVTVDIGSQTVVGTNINDTFSNIENVSGTNLDDTFFGDSNDNIFDGLGHINGDTINYSGETDSVSVDLSNETGTGTTIGTDTLVNIEIIEGTEFDDTLIGSADTNTINGNGGNDLINDDAGNDTVNGGAGNDTIEGSAGNDTIDGGAGDDDLLDFSGAANDVEVWLSILNNTSSSEFGVDTLINLENISGGIGSDFLVGSAVSNDITGGDGDDTIYGLDDNDVLSGEGGTDTIYGGNNDDTISGGDDNDALYGNNGDDIITGDAGDDTIDGGAGDDELYGNEGIDNISGGAGADTIDGGDGGDTLSGGIGIDNISGSAGNDTIYGGDGNDVLDGGADDDTIYGEAGDDTLEGAEGNDTLDGGAGTDTIDESANSGDLVVTLNDASGSLVDGGETDTLIAIENVTTGSGADQFFISDSDNNLIDGGSGNNEATISGVSGITTVIRTGTVVDVSDTGGGAGTDQFTNIQTINVTGNVGNDLIQLTDENDNTVTGNGGTDTVDVTKNNDVAGTITITRTGTDVNVSGTGIGNDDYLAIDTVNVTGGATADDTFELTDENDNTIDGSGGDDEITVYNTSDGGESITINRSGTMVTVTGTGGVGEDTYNNIEQVNVTAGDGDDTFNIFDELDNIFDGGAGDDTADYSLTGVSLNITFDPSGTNIITGTGIGTDVLINIENILSGSGNDTFFVEDEDNNSIDGGAGNDEVNVTMDTSTTIYDGIITIVRSPANVVTVTGDGFGTDVYTNIEKVDVTSSSGDDVFRPNDDQANDFDAGAGNDWIDYSSLSTGVNVDLSTGLATGDGNDTLTGFENISGSTGDDVLIGDSNANIIDGGDGSDDIDGGDGDDTITGGAGTLDVLDGGNGTDTFDESNATAMMDISIVNGNGSSNSTELGLDLLIDFENINTGSGDDLISLQDATQNIVDVGGGTDEITAINSTTTSSLTVTRSGNDVTLTDAGTGFGDDQYYNVEQVNITGGSGADNFTILDSNDNVIAGSGGTDSINYSGATGDLTVTFDTSNTVAGTDTGTDTLTGIETYTTGSGNDDFIFNTDVGTVSINSGAGVDQTYDFNAGADGIISLTDGGTTPFLDFRDYDDVVDIDLSDATAQALNSGLTLTLNGTFTNISGSAQADTIVGTTASDTIYGGDSADILSGNDGADTIFGEAGNDTLNGGAGNDTLNGGSGVDILNGGANDDILSGGAGNDTIDGGAGVDEIDESANTNDLIVTLSNGAGSIVDGAETDTVSNVENLTTGSGADTFFISDSDDNIIDANGGSDEATVSGGSGTITITRTGNNVDISDTGGGIGNDQLINLELINVSGSASDDTFVVNDDQDNEFNGLGGTDTLSYAGLSSDVTVTITDDQAVVDTSGIGTDTLISIENILTGSGADTFDITGTVDYTLNAGTVVSGIDTFLFNTSVDGTLGLEASGSAHLDFSSFTSSGITIDLGNNTSQSVTGSLDITLTGTFNTISGTTLIDDITGSAGADIIWASDGNDIVDGAAGNDIIRGGVGNDTIDGGANTDTFDESDSTSDMTVVLNNAVGSSSSAVEGNDSLSNIENVNSGSGADDFTLSDSDANTINAGGGSDVVTILNATNVTIQRTGNDVSVTDNATGVGNDQYIDVEQVNISGTSGNDVFTMEDEFDNIINGQGGTNEVDYSQVAAVVNVNVLATGTTVDSTGVGTDTLINIQNITTGDEDDVFIIEENSVDNVLDAGSEQTATGDTATYTKVNNVDGTITANRSGNTVTVDIDSSDSDTLTDFESVDFVGSDADDTFVIQDNTDNTIDGGNEGSNGDTYDTTFTSNDVTVDTSGGTVTASDDGSEIGTDTLISIENVVTGDGDDTFIIDTDVAGSYFFNAGGDSTLGNLFQFTGGGSQVVNVTIEADSTAEDTLDFSLFTGGAADIDLNDTTEQEVSNNLFVTFNSFVDNVVGTDNDDTIAGNSLDNDLDGGDGNDTIGYSTGDDNIDGGAGTDTMDYTDAPGAITATLDSSGVTVDVSGSTDTQTVSNMEAVSATNNDDTIVVNGAISTTVNAGGGTDTVDYSGLTDAINVDLSTGTGSVSGTSSSDDHTLNDVEDVIGSNFDDTIVGNDENNDLDGGQGDDVIQGNGGDDNIDGGSGNDTVSYKDADSGVDVDLDSGSSSGGDDNDTLTSIENVSGSSHNDTISGTSGSNVIYGGDGDDVVYGGEGDDVIYGEGGDDELYGGSNNPVSGTSDGSDEIYGGDDNDTIYGGNNNTNTSDASDAGDTIEGNDGNDTIYGGNNNGSTGSGDDGGDNIDGGAGNDDISGGNNNTGGGSGDDTSGSDTIEGGDDDDTIHGGNDNTDGGSGDDGDDTITDTDDTGNDTDLTYGGNDNTSGGGSAGTGADGTDNIDVADGDNSDEATGDNQVDADTTDDPTTGGDQDTITSDPGDNQDDGDGS